MSVHELKIAPEWYDRVESGDKVAEVRLHDRDFQAGDTVELAHATDTNNHSLTALITHVLPLPQVPGFLDDIDSADAEWCVLSLCLEAVHTECRHSVIEAGAQ